MENNFERVAIGQSSYPGPPRIDLRVLVVDDDATTLAVVSSMLQICSYKVETAKNPLDALATLRLYNGLFDLVVTDLHMPFMNGFELTKQIGKEFKLPVILMSADEKEDILTEIVRCGIAHFISKPVTRDDLKNVWQFVDRTKKGKSVVMIDEIGHPTPLRRHNNVGGLDRPIQPYGGSFGSGSTGFRSYKRSSGDRDHDHGKGEGSNNKKPCHRNEREHRVQRRKRSKKTKIVWTNSLHNRFLMAMRHLGYNTVPKKILDFMNVPGLTRENVASHLQKYRMFLKRVAENGVLDATKMLTDRFMRSSFATGYPVDLMLEHAKQMYPHLFRGNQHKHNYQNTPIPLPRIISSSSSPFQLGSTSRGPAMAHQPPSRPVGLSTLLMDNRPSSTAAGSTITSPGLVSRTYSLLNNTFGNNNSNNTTTNNNNYNLPRNPTTTNNIPTGAGQTIPTRFDSSGFLSGQSSFFSSGASSSSSFSSSSQIKSVVGGGYGSVVGGSNSFGDNTGFLNQSNQVPILPVPENDSELRVEDYASDLNDIAFEEAHDQRSLIDQVNNTLTNQPDAFTAVQPRTQIQSNERGLLNALDSFLPPIDPIIPIQPQGNEQTLQNALPSDNYLPSIHLQPQGNKQAVQNTGGFNDVITEPILLNPGINNYNNSNSNNDGQPLGFDQFLPDSGNNISLPSNSYLSVIGEQSTLLQTHQNDLFNDAFQSEGYVPLLGETNLIQQHGGYGSALDPFQNINLENVQSELDWDEFMGSLLNDGPAPDLRK